MIRLVRRAASLRTVGSLWSDRVSPVCAFWSRDMNSRFDGTRLQGMSQGALTSAGIILDEELIESAPTSTNTNHDS